MIGLIERLGVDSSKQNDSHYYTLSQLFAELNAEHTDGLMSHATFSNTTIYFPIAHMLPAMSMMIARQLGMPPLIWLYVGRLTNALMAVAVSTLAIAFFEESGLFALALCSLPMVLFEEASLSADALVLPFSILLSALMLRIARQPALGWRFFLVLSVSLLYVAVAKIAYIPIVLLPPFIAITKHRKRSETFSLICISAASVALWVVWSSLVHDKVFTIDNHSGVVDVQTQLHDILRNPLIFVDALRRTLTNVHYLIFLIETLFGSRLGWLNIFTPKAIIALSMMTLAAASIFRRPTPRLGVPIRVFTSLLLLGSLVAIFLLLYLQFTPVGQNWVDGAQGRYFIPLLAFLPLTLPAWPAPNSKVHRVAPIIMLCSQIASIATVIIVWKAYWTA